MASNVFFANSWVALTLPYHVLPLAFDWLAAYARICETVSDVAPPNALLVFRNVPEQVATPVELSIILQTVVRSTVTPPIGAGAAILFPPSAGSLKYTSSAVASICALSMAFIDAPLAFAALMMLYT